MTPQTLLAFGAISFISSLSPGPAVLLALRNGVAFGARTVAWSSFGNVAGLVVVSATAMLGLGSLLKTSALLFGMVKTLGALYLLYIGLRQLFGRNALVLPEAASDLPRPARARLFREAFFLAITNPKAILFFTALFPQFIDAHQRLLPQFLILTIVSATLSFAVLMGYAIAASRVRAWFASRRFAMWVNRAIGVAFITLAAFLLALRRPAT